MTRRKRNALFSVFVKRIFCAVLLLGLLISVSCPVLAAEGDIKIDETKSLLEDSDTSGEGYLRVEATTPVGFEGTLCVELRRGFSRVSPFSCPLMSITFPDSTWSLVHTL